MPTHLRPKVCSQNKLMRVYALPIAQSQKVICPVFPDLSCLKASRAVFSILSSRNMHIYMCLTTSSMVSLDDTCILLRRELYLRSSHVAEIYRLFGCGDTVVRPTAIIEESYTIEESILYMPCITSRIPLLLPRTSFADHLFSMIK